MKTFEFAIACFSLITISEICFMWCMFSETIRYGKYFDLFYGSIAFFILLGWYFITKSGISSKQMLLFIVLAQLAKRSAGVIIPWVKIGTVSKWQIIGLVMCATGSAMIVSEKYINALLEKLQSIF